MTDTAKHTAGVAAASVIEPGQVLGFGTGSTVAHFLTALAERNLGVHGVATSEQTAQRCRQLGIEVRSVDEVSRVDLVVDGADELTPQLALTKGGGAALLREKVVAQMADQMLVIATPDKVVERLGDSFDLPIEVVPYALAPVRRRLERAGWHVTHRDVTTDNGNDILDARLPGGIVAPHETAAWLAGIAGVAEHGLFLDLATAAVLGRGDRSVEWLGSL